MPRADGWDKQLELVRAMSKDDICARWDHTDKEREALASLVERVERMAVSATGDSVSLETIIDDLKILQATVGARAVIADPRVSLARHMEDIHRALAGIIERIGGEPYPFKTCMHARPAGSFCANCFGVAVVMKPVAPTEIPPVCPSHPSNRPVKENGTLVCSLCKAKLGLIGGLNEG